MIGRFESMLRRMRRRISRSEWTARWLKLPKSEGTEAKPGLVMIQIDGLARTQLESGLLKGRMPFLKYLLKKEGYRLHTMYSGLPSNTPSVQAELFYGVKCAVPAFGYQDRQTHRLMSLYEPSAALQVQESASSMATGAPLLGGGSAYSDFYTGGARESHFCATTIGWNAMLRAANPFALAALLVWHAWSVVRVGTLLIVEFVLAVIDFIRGCARGHNLWKELKFVPTRVAISVLLREIVTIGAALDAVRGLPVIHLNYLGYDEQSHRRGPSSAFAHWTLKGIDDGIKRVWRAARHSARRDYDIWIYSDHGQEKTASYETIHGRSIQEAVTEVFDGRRHDISGKRSGGTQLARAAYLGGLGRWLPRNGKSPDSQNGSGPLVMALGPIGHIYCDPTVQPDERPRLAGKLIAQAKIPLVLAPDGPETAKAWTDAGEFTLPNDAKQVLGADHPFLDEAALDLVALCHHPDSGTFVISGWHPQKPPMTFPVETGAHGGPGTEETRAFALVSRSAPLDEAGRGYLRPVALREAALQVLGRLSEKPRRRPTARKTIRIMTYNVHSCRGMDGRLSTDRIAKVIAYYDPDIVALQELDVGRSRTGDIDQAKVIARTLDMTHHFHPAFRLAEEQYGDAVLSHYPMKLVKAGGLPRLARAPYLEPRGALWVSIAVNGNNLQLINTHLGLSRRERLLQIEALLGPDWVAHPDCESPVVVCGDFNALPGSIICQKLGHRLQDVQCALADHKPKATWFGRYPINRIDHVFIDNKITVQSVEVPRTMLTRVASDHLPLVVELTLP